MPRDGSSPIKHLPTLANASEVFVKPVGKQRRVGLPSGIRMSDAFTHNKSGRHLRLAQALDKPARLLNRHRFVLVTMNENRRRGFRTDMSCRGEIPQHAQHPLTRSDRLSGASLRIEFVEPKGWVDTPALTLHSVEDARGWGAEIR